MDLREGLLAAAAQLGVSPLDLATIVSYETAGSLDPMKRGPRTQHGQHKGLIQWGEPQAQRYLGGDFSIPSQSQGIVSYMKDAGVTPGTSLLDMYSAVNAGRVGRHNASDANNGGAWGTVKDKVAHQMAGHRRNAERLLGSTGQDPIAQPPMAQPPPNIAGIGSPNMYPPADQGPDGQERPPSLMDKAAQSLGIPTDIAEFYSQDDDKKGSMLGRMGRAMANIESPPAPRLGGMSGPTDAQTMALMQALKGRGSLAELFERKRRGA